MKYDQTIVHLQDQDYHGPTGQRYVALVTPPPNMYHAVLVACDEDDDEMAANVALHAAAPDAIAVLADLFDAMRCPRDIDDPELTDDEPVTLDVTLGQLRAAAATIARARGTHP